MSVELQGKLRTVRVNFAGAMMANCLMRRVSATERRKAAGRVIVGEDGFYCVGHNAKVPEEAGEFYEISIDGSTTARDRAAMELAKMALRNMTSDTYEAVFEYCEAHGQLPSMQAQDWYQFARVIRNSLTHTQFFRFHPRVLAILPVTWKGRTIDASRNGIEVPFTFFDWYVGLELFKDIYEFAGTLP